MLTVLTLLFRDPVTEKVGNNYLEIVSTDSWICVLVKIKPEEVSMQT